MSSTRVARHRAASRPSTPFTLAAKSIIASEQGRRVSALAGSGVALTVIAAGAIPTGGLQDRDVNSAQSVDAATVTQAVVKKVATNPAVSAGSEAAGATSVAAVDQNATNAAAHASNKVSTTPAPASNRSQVRQPENYDANFPWDSVKGNRVLEIARQYLGVPYKWGASGPSAFDCSGLVSYVYRQVGINLPHSSGQIGRMGHAVPVSAAQPCDILWKSGHVALYVGNGMILHAPKPGDHVKIQKIYSGFVKAIRF